MPNLIFQGLVKDFSYLSPSEFSYQICLGTERCTHMHVHGSGHYSIFDYPLKGGLTSMYFVDCIRVHCFIHKNKLSSQICLPEISGFILKSYICSSKYFQSTLTNGSFESLFFSNSRRANFRSTLHAFTIICKLAPPVNLFQVSQQTFLQNLQIQSTQVHTAIFHFHLIVQGQGLNTL